MLEYFIKSQTHWALFSSVYGSQMALPDTGGDLEASGISKLKGGEYEMKDDKNHHWDYAIVGKFTSGWKVYRILLMTLDYTLNYKLQSHSTRFVWHTTHVEWINL